MSILYCSLILNKEKTKIAESSIGKSFVMQIKSLLPQIFKNSINDRIQFEDYYLTYTRSKEIIYLCVSPKRLGEERPRLFIESLINNLISKKIDILSDENSKTKKSFKELALNNKLQELIDLHISNFNSGFEDSSLIIKDLQKDVDELKGDVRKIKNKEVANINTLQEQLLKTSDNLRNNTKVFMKNGKEIEGRTRMCCKPWVIKSMIITGSILLSIGITYVTIALVRCNNLNAFC